MRGVYRGQDIGDLQQLEQTCLSILKDGNVTDLYNILPHLSIIRSRDFRVPVEALLESKDRNKKQFAVIALGILGGDASVEPLAALIPKIQQWHGPGIRSLERTLISALGDSGTEAAIPPLLEIFELSRPRDKFANERRCAVVTALACLVQQGVEDALPAILRLMEHRLTVVRSQAANELAFAYWYDPEGMPQEAVQALAQRIQDPDAGVQEAARSSLEELVTLGNSQARKVIS